MKFTASLKPFFNVGDFAKANGEELTYATASTYYFELLERERDLASAVKEVEESEISEYALEAAAHGINRMIERTQEHRSMMIFVFQDARQLYVDAQLTFKQSTTPEWKYRTETLMSGNYGALWQRCKSWLASGADDEAALPSVSPSE